MTTNDSAEEITIGTASPEDWDDVYAMFMAALNFEGNPVSLEAEREVFEADRTLVARLNGHIVGTIAAVTRKLAVPGAVIPAAHSGRGAVSVTARRRGLLTQLLTTHIKDIKALGESISVCWASEGQIYQRYGYGLAVRRMAVNVNTREVGVPKVASDNLISGTTADLRKELVSLYDKAYQERPGWSQRTEASWNSTLADIPFMRGAATAHRVVAHQGPDGAIDGYAIWRATGAWTDTGPAGEVQVLEHVITTPEAYAAIWQFLLTVDLTRSATVWGCSLDEPLLYWVAEPRRLAPTICDGLWVRVIDVPKALAERRYGAPVDLVIETEDKIIPDNTGRWRLTGSPDTATCTRTTDPADLVIDLKALGAAYLGGASLPSLAAAGLVKENTPGALAAAGNAFSWHVSPSAFEIF